VASQITTTSARFSWTASTGPVANYTVQVIDGNLVPWHDLATTSSTTYTHTGLNPDTVYIYRVIANPRSGSGYTASEPSAALYVTTAPLPDSQPPTKPGTPRASASTIAVTITFDASTDNNRVAGYWVQRQVNGVWTDWSTNNITTVYLRDLTPNTSYTVVVVAFDPNGNRSVRSDPLTFSTRPTQPSPTCKVQLITFGTQYLLNVSIENMTAATVLANWTFTFTMPAAHTLNYIFNATLARSGDRATASPAWYNATIGPGGSATFGLNAVYPAGSPLPSGFTLNGGGGSFPCTT
jgi:chitodextrinase